MRQAPGPDPSAAARSTASIVPPAIVYAVLFAAVGAWFPYFSVFFASIGLSLQTVGLIVAVQGTTSLVAAPIWGSIADAVRDVRWPLLVAGLWSAGAAALVAVARDPIAVAVAVSLLAAGTAGMVPLVDTRTIQRLGSDRDRFGRARAWGSASFIAGSLVTGTVIAATRPVAMFAIYAPLLAVSGVVAFLLLGRSDPRATRVANAWPMASLAGHLRRPSLGLLLAGSILIWSCVAATMTFISIHVLELGGDTQFVGLVWAIGAAIEVPIMLAFPGLARRFGSDRLMVLGTLAFAARAAGWALAPGPLVVLLVAPLGGIAFACFYVGTVTHVSRLVPANVAATAQGVFTGTAFSLGSIVGSVVGGLVAGATSLPAMFGLAAVGTLVGAAIVWRAVVAARAASIEPHLAAVGERPAL
jgi:PPP family 3-phenylpropionic acid transporter